MLGLCNERNYGILATQCPLTSSLLQQLAIQHFSNSAIQQFRGHYNSGDTIPINMSRRFRVASVPMAFFFCFTRRHEDVVLGRRVVLFSHGRLNHWHPFNRAARWSTTAVFVSLCEPNCDIANQPQRANSCLQCRIRTVRIEAGNRHPPRGCKGMQSAKISFP